MHYSAIQLSCNKVAMSDLYIECHFISETFLQSANTSSLPKLLYYISFQLEKSEKPWLYTVLNYEFIWRDR